ncbi:glycoside hydrolase family 73 protein [Paenibacillus favisporus]|uniref:glycoside hydrolase family 73 protein n=1 Tax=Paenibacillus favisporus TaxID=221028 RepID=UPI0013D0A763|nr:glycoside hydrolase family 73 protein [Paenibacillus favisporus]
MNQTEFIATLAPCAIADMQATGVPASLTIAQAILESNWGTSGLARQANNLFGIKGKGTAGSVEMPTTEYVNGKAVKVVASFRKYHSWTESIADHSKLLLNGTKDKPTRYHGMLRADYRQAAEAVWKGGYATDPKYPSKLIAIMEQYGLPQYDTWRGEHTEMSVNITELAQQLEDLKKKAERLTQLEVLLQKVEQRISALEARQQIEVPAWAESAVNAAVEAKIISTPVNGSYDLYRMLTILQRLKVL